MAKKVAEARLDITAKDKSKTAFNSVQGRLKRMKDAMLSMKGVMVGTMVVGFVAMAKEAAKTADAIGKFADRAGVTTDSLQKMRYAFDLAGVGVEAVDKAFLTFGKRLGKAHQGIGALAGGLKGGEEALLEKLKATNSTTEALDVMFRAMGNAETQTRKLAIADAAFGMAGLRMTAAFRDGADAFYEAQQRAADLGIVLDERLIRNAEKMNDELTTVAQVLKLQFTATVLELAPAITSLATGFLELTMAVRGLGEIAPDVELNLLAKSIENVRNQIGFLQEQQEGGTFGLFPADHTEQIEFLNEKLKKLLATQKKLKGAAVDGSRQYKTPAGPYVPVSEGGDIKTLMDVLDFHEIFEKKREKEFADTLKQEKLEEKVHKSWLDDHYKQAELLRYEVAHGKEKTKNMEALFALERQRGREFTPTESEDTLSAIESSYRIIDQLKTKIKETEIEQQSWKQNDLELMRLKLQFAGDRIGIQVLEEQVALEELLGRDLLPDELESLKKKVELFDELNQRLKLQNDIAAMGERVFDRMGDGMLTAMQRGEDAMESFKNVAVAALFDVQREMFKLFVFAPLKKALFSCLGGLMSPFTTTVGESGLGSENIVESIITPYGTDPGIYDDMPKFASGGYAHGGRMALVGERGPELFMPRVGGTVIPNDQLGGGGVNITLNFSTGVQSTVRAEVMGLMPIISENVKSAVAEARMRGGSFSAAMGV